MGFFLLAVSYLLVSYCRSSQSSLKLAPTGHVISGPLSLPQYMVLEDYKKVQKGELSVTAGSIVFVVEKKHTGKLYCFFIYIRNNK